MARQHVCYIDILSYFHHLCYLERLNGQDYHIGNTVKKVVVGTLFGYSFVTYILRLTCSANFCLVSIRVQGLKVHVSLLSTLFNIGFVYLL